MKYSRFLLLSSALYMLSIPAYAGEALTPRADVSLKGGTERNILMTEFWMPLAQKNDSVWYGDVRLMGDNDDNREGNLGFGYRQTVPKFNAVLGASAWIDRRLTRYNNYLHQTTIGMELLGKKFDIRNNYYIPLNGAKNSSTPNIGSTTPYLAGSGIFFDTNGIVTETPQFGMDGEVGYRLPIFENHIDSFRVYAGAYHFFRDNTENVTGYRIRTEAQINKALSVGLRFQHDGARGSQGFVEATLRFPFSAKKMYQTDSLRSRLDESPERDIDIVTGSKVVDTGLRKPVLNAVSGATQRVLYVDNSAAGGGTGTKENPYNTLATAQAALQDNDVLYINRGTGTTTGMNQGLVINKTGVTLIGSGADFIWDSSRFIGSTGSPQNGTLIAAKTAAPVITNVQAFVNDGGGAVATSNTGNGIMVTADNAFISGITVTGASATGIYVVADSGATHLNSVRISDVTSSSNAFGRGIFVYARNGATIDNVSISNSTANNNAGGSAGRGIEVRSAIGSSLINTITIDNNRTAGNSQYGVFAYAFNSGRIGDVTMSNNITTGNVSYGAYVLGATNGQINNAIVTGNTSLNNGVYGILTTAGLNSTVNNVILTGNTANNTTGAGGSAFFVGVNGTGGVMNGATVSNNTASNNNGAYGLWIYSASATSVLTNINVFDNTLTGNGLNGLYVQKSNVSSTFTVDLGGGFLNSIGQNKITGNTGTEVRIDGGVAISAKNNYWGGTDLAPGEKTLGGGSTIDTSDFLTTDPRP